MMILFQGSGPGVDQGFTLQAFSPESGERLSYRPSDASLSSLRAVDERRLIAVRGFGARRQEIVLVDTQSDSVEVLAWTEGGALMFPVVAPDGASIAVLLIPGRTDAPPRTVAAASLGILPMPDAASGPDERQLGPIDILAEDLPAIPFDWGPSSRSLYYTIVDPPQIARFDLESRTTSTVRQGLFPRLNPEGRLLAFIDGRDVVVVHADRPTEVVASQTLEGHPGWLAWSPDGQVLAITEELPLWRVRMGLLSVAERSYAVAAETSRCKSLVWVGKAPAWPRFEDGP